MFCLCTLVHLLVKNLPPRPLEIHGSKIPFYRKIVRQKLKMSRVNKALKRLNMTICPRMLIEC
jgi:hypothetical protein